MPDIQKVSVALTGEQVAALEAAVEAGEYATTGEIVREALRDWQFKQELRRKDVERLRRLWDEGKASGPAEPFDVERTLAAARARLEDVAAESTAVFQSPAAERDLQDIWLTIAADNPGGRTRIVRAIGARIDRLAEYPRLGPRRPDVRPAMRVLVEAPYLILFETHPDNDEGRDRPRSKLCASSMAGAI